MRAIERLWEKARQRLKQKPETLVMIYKRGGEWVAASTTMNKGKCEREGRIFYDKESAIAYGEERLKDKGVLLIDDVTE